jgi:DNA (cytosine-5)-methyltransferase 1
VLVENVREFLNFGGGKFSSDLVKKFQEIGYDVAYRKLCAADFGVPQVRHRVFFVAVKSAISDKIGSGPVFPLGEFFEPASQMFLGPTQTYHTVRDAISDLPSPTYERHSVLRYPEGTCVSQLAAQLRNTDGEVFNHFARHLSSKQLQRIKAVGAGRMKHVDTRLRTRSFYGSAYRRLSWDEPALTITTWVYHVGSGRFAHPTEDRGITMREAARLQTFDDGFVFPPLINPVSQMIGNAVPPLLASKFAHVFVSLLDRLKPNEYRIEHSSPANGLAVRTSDLDFAIHTPKH